MLISSLGPQEGKTTTLCNLGIVMAQAGKKVLLVDSDMRKPRLHGIFKHKNEKGLSDFLSMQANFEDIIEQTDMENVSFISAGTTPPNPSELLSSHKAKEFIDKAKKDFDIILFDTPPSAVVTDAMILSRVVDGVIMVVESGKTSKRALPRIFNLLKDSNAKVIGAILNRISPSTSNYYHYHSYYYGRKK
jgi:protein-tyrosine kinase